MITLNKNLGTDFETTEIASKRMVDVSAYLLADLFVKPICLSLSIPYIYPT